MSASLLRLKSGKIGLFFLAKNSSADLHLWVRFSTDEARTWGEPNKITLDPGYNIVNNDRIIQLSSKRLIVPVSYTPDISIAEPLVSFVLYSDDEGHSWKKSLTTLTVPKRGAMEPGVVELKDHRLLMILRTQMGRIYRSMSGNSGESWEEAVVTELVSPESPASITRIPGRRDLLLIWNNNPDSESNHRAPRTPLTSAISRDDGRTWTHIHNIEADPQRTFAYTSIAFFRKQVLLTYYDTVQWSKGLSLRFRSIPLEWFYK